MLRGNKKTWKVPAIVALATLLGIVAPSLPAFAWNDEGHMAVAYLAYERLEPATKNRVNSMLQLNPNYSKWLKTIPTGASEADAKMMVFMIAATWADQIKSDPSYTDDGHNGGNTPDGATSSQNIGYRDHLRHKYWHFIDIPYSPDGTTLPPVPTPNAETQIAAFRKILGSPGLDALKSYDLVWIEHPVGDVHQPLHAITRVSGAIPSGDAGGSLVRLCNAPCRVSLHTFWDDLIGSRSQFPEPDDHSTQSDLRDAIKSAIDAARRLPQADERLALTMDQSTWVRESFDKARQYVHVLPVGPGTGPFTLTQQYRDSSPSGGTASCLGRGPASKSAELGTPIMSSTAPPCTLFGNREHRL